MKIYDHVIIGGGLSGLLKAESLMSTLLDDQSVLIIDPEPKNVCLRTFCVWRLKTDQNHPHKDLVSHRYSHFRITSAGQKKGTVKSFDDFVYERIPGEMFYKYMFKKIFSDKKFQIIELAVTSVNEYKNYVRVEMSDGQIIHACKVWNSLVQSKPDVIQHFFGFEIETESDFFTENIVDLMDFRVDQSDEVRFVYQLPFSKRAGLIEFTIFSSKILSAEEYEKLLRVYLDQVHSLKDFKIRNIEIGKIPMALDPWPKFSSPMGYNRITAIGGAAGKIKTSTGYSFMRNQSAFRPDFNSQLTSFSTSILRYFEWRFQIYDTLLIGIMKSNGSAIAEIFPKLFARNSSDVLFRFLDEKTNFFEEIKIFIKLPWSNFLKQLLLNYPFLCISFFVIVVNLIPSSNQLDPFFLSWLFPVLGLLTLGISHGAVDHLLNPDISKIKFYFHYFIGLFSFFIFWYINPILSLIIFILISGDHFGENQFLRALKISGNQLKVRGLTILWGTSVSLMAPFFHWNEAVPIIKILIRNSEIIDSISVNKANLLGFLAASFSIASAFLISKYERKATGRIIPGFLSTIFLCFTFWIIPLIPGFLTFFCFWHAKDTIIQQRKALNLSAKEYFLRAAPFSAAASLSLLCLVYFFDSLENIWSYLFLLLGTLTVSHSVVMKRFYKS